MRDSKYNKVLYEKDRHTLLTQLSQAGDKLEFIEIMRKFEETFNARYKDISLRHPQHPIHALPLSQSNDLISDLRRSRQFLMSLPETSFPQSLPLPNANKESTNKEFIRYSKKSEDSFKPAKSLTETPIITPPKASPLPKASDSFLKDQLKQSKELRHLKEDFLNSLILDSHPVSLSSLVNPLDSYAQQMSRSETISNVLRLRRCT
jgi:hypothetical protein